MTTDLLAGFRDPPRSCTPKPFWFWNGAMELAEVERQLEAMVDQGVHSAYVHARPGLRPRYLSDAWFELVAGAARKARSIGFDLRIIDEFNWPAGEARDLSLPGYPSRVLHRRPELRQRTLRAEVLAVAGPARADDPDRLHLAVVGRRVADGPLDGERLRCVEDGAWEVPEGHWTIYQFYLRESVGIDGGLVDILDPRTTETFLEEVHERYLTALGPLPEAGVGAFFMDHEGDYGYRQGWTPALYDEFERRKGYDLRPLLPLLWENGGPRTPQVRCDYYDVIADLYVESYWQPVTQWCLDRGLECSGHGWENDLHHAVAFHGDHMRVQRALGQPGIDVLWETARSPRHVKEAATVARVTGRRLMVEHGGVEGSDSYMSLDRARRTINRLVCWGCAEFVPHAFNANPDRIDFPEDWFETQPWWTSFHRLSTYTARLTHMLGALRRVPRVAVFHPLESAWANAAPVAREDLWNYAYSSVDAYQGHRIRWGNVVDDIDDAYSTLMTRLPLKRCDVDVLDAHYLEEAEIGEGVLKLAGAEYEVLLVPPMTCVRRSTLERFVEHAAAGGIVIAVGPLARDSMEVGADDAELERLWDVLTSYPTCAVVGDASEAVERALDAVGADLRLLSGPSEDLKSLRLRGTNGPVAWLFNDGDRAGRFVVDVDGMEAAGRWDPEDGGVRPTPAEGGGLAVALEAGQAVFLVADEQPAAASEGEPAWRPVRTLGGDWRITPQAKEVVVAHARVRICAPGTGVEMGWHRATVNDAFWPTSWLSPERFTIRDWHLLGPFDYDFHRGWSREFGPEGGIDLQAPYVGKGAAELRWRRWSSPDRVVNLNDALEIPMPPWTGERWNTAYAVTWVHSGRARRAQLRFTPDSNARAWVNGVLVHAERDDSKSYLELHDAYGYRVDVTLRAGWNELLLKVSQGMRHGGQFAFVARFCNASGQPLDDLHASADRSLEHDTPEPAEHWYRCAIPPGARAVRLSQGVDAFADGTEIRDGRLTNDAGVLSVRSESPLTDFIRFEAGTGSAQLGSWSHTGLSYFSGVCVYEIEFEVDEVRRGRHAIDLGDVGTQASVHLNGIDLGHRPWGPFRFEVGEALRVGANRLRVAVGNTGANRRAQGPDGRIYWGLPVRGPALLNNLETNGLLGPVRILQAE